MFADVSKFYIYNSKRPKDAYKFFLLRSLIKTIKIEIETICFFLINPCWRDNDYHPSSLYIHISATNMSRP